MSLDWSGMLINDADRDGERIFNPSPRQSYQPDHGANILKRVSGRTHDQGRLSAHPTAGATTMPVRQCRSWARSTRIDSQFLRAGIAAILVHIRPMKCLLQV